MMRANGRDKVDPETMKKTKYTSQQKIPSQNKIKTKNKQKM